MSLKTYPKFTEFLHKPILAVDYGQKFTGLATFTPGRDPFPLLHGRLAYKDDQKLINDLIKIIDEESTEIVVIGLPTFLDGKESTMTKTVRNFIELLQKQIPQKIFEQDETLSTVEAEERMKNSPRFNFKVNYQEIDAMSASIILEDFIRSP